MSSVVCTLFEGHYHLGVAALSNSLYSQGYRGEIFVGYRGSLPPWAASATEDPTLNWPGSRTLTAASELRLHFLPLDTDYHLTNYKPDFMLRLWQGISSKANALFYFDPDIIVTTPWKGFELWVECGVALCEDVNSPIAEHHPIREAWRCHFKKSGFTLRFKYDVYTNGGFIGLIKRDISFLETWKAVQEAMAPAIGGLARSAFTGADPMPFDPFGKTDQDALNATVEAWDGTLSLLGKEAMAFNPGTKIMSHALGKLKPWLIEPLTQAIAGRRPRSADKDYWQLANGPIVSQPFGLVKRRQLAIKLAAFIGRFYSQR
jgi:hypothetical protein